MKTIADNPRGSGLKTRGPIEWPFVARCHWLYACASTVLSTANSSLMFPPAPWRISPVTCVESVGIESSNPTRASSFFKSTKDSEPSLSYQSLQTARNAAPDTPRQTATGSVLATVAVRISKALGRCDPCDADVTRKAILPHLPTGVPARIGEH